MNALLEARGPDVPAAAEPLELEWFRAFYKEHANFVRDLVQRFAGRRSDCDDLIQEVFLVAYQKWPSLAGGPPSSSPSSSPGSSPDSSPDSSRVDPRNWLYGVAVRVLRREWRRRKLRALLLLERSEPRADEQTPAGLLERDEARARVHRLLESLSQNKRTVFVLREIEGLSGQQIAEILRVPIQTVWNRLFHARKEFLKLLAREQLRERREMGEP